MFPKFLQAGEHNLPPSSHPMLCSEIGGGVSHDGHSIQTETVYTSAREWVPLARWLYGVHWWGEHAISMPAGLY